MLNLSIVTITLNEERNLPFLLENVKGFAKDVVVVDSGSTDRTLEIAHAFGCRVFHRDFDNYSNQRNYSLKEVPFDTEWLLVLDADEVLTSELKVEIAERLKQCEQVDAFMFKRRFYWMGAWVKRGYYPTWLLRMGRVGKLYCDDRGINEHLLCESDKVEKLKNDFIDENHNGIAAWVAKHNRYSDYEAEKLLADVQHHYSFWKSQYERKRWLRINIWNKLPMFTRPFLLLMFRLFIQLAILDGRRAILYHFLHSFIYRFIIDAKSVELKRFNKNG